MNVPTLMYVLTEGFVGTFLEVFNAFVPKGRFLMLQQKSAKTKMSVRLRWICAAPMGNVSIPNKDIDVNVILAGSQIRPACELKALRGLPLFARRADLRSSRSLLRWLLLRGHVKSPAC